MQASNALLPQNIESRVGLPTPSQKAGSCAPAKWINVQPPQMAEPHLQTTAFHRLVRTLLPECLPPPKLHVIRITAISYDVVEPHVRDRNGEERRESQEKDRTTYTWRGPPAGYLRLSPEQNFRPGREKKEREREKQSNGYRMLGISVQGADRLEKAIKMGKYASLLRVELHI